MTLSRRKTIIYFALSLALVTAAVFWVGAPEAQAKVDLTSIKNTALKALGGLSEIGVGLAVVYIVLLVIYEFAYYMVAFAGLFLDTLYAANIIIVPSTSPIVLLGWTALRDIANGLFILLVLWVAITIIFNLETLGGKRLLVRIIVVALLINFSLLMTTVVFAFANQLALPFSRALGMDPYNPKVETTLSSMIMNETKLHTLAKTISEEGATEQFKKSVEEAKTAASQQERTATPTSFWIASVTQSLGISPVIPPAQAGLKEGAEAGGICLAALGLPSILTGGTLLGVCGIAAIAAGAFLNATDISGTVGKVAGWVVRPYVNLAVADMFLIFTAAALASAAVLLAVRYMAIMFLGVFAPIAFLGLVVPRYGEKIWNMWLENLFRWAFVAPIFYFLLYLSIYMLQAVSSAQLKFEGTRDIPFQGNALQIFSWAIFLVFLWASIFLTRKAAGMGAEAALAFGKKLAGVGLGVGTGLAARKALPLMGRLATGLQEKINQSPLARATFGRGLTAFGLGTATRASRKQLADRQTYINNQGWTSAEIQQRLASGYFKSNTDVAAAVGVLKSRGDLDKQAGVEGYGAQHIERAAGVYRGLKTDLVPLMRANPTIATQADFSPAEFDPTNPRSAINEVLGADGRSGTAPKDEDYKEATKLLAWRRLRPQDVDTFDLDLLKNDNNKRRFLEVATGDHLSRLGRRDTRVAGDLQTYLDNPANKGLWDSFSDAKQQYFTSSTARSIGVWHLPPYTGGMVKQDTSFRVLQPVVSASAPTGTPAYTGPFLVGGGTPPYTATLRNGALPAGLSIDPATGQLGGSTVGIPADSTFVADYDITDSSGTTRPERVSIHITIT